MVAVVCYSSDYAPVYYLMGALGFILQCKNLAEFSLADVTFLKHVNYSTGARSVVKTVNEHGIYYDNILIIDSDNANYIKNAFCTVKDLHSQSLPRQYLSGTL